MKIRVYGIDTCQSCKKAKAYLSARGVSFEWIDLRKDAPSRASITAWVKSLGAKALRNTSGGSYRALGSAKDSWTDADWIDAYVNDPMLIKRPVVVVDGEVRAVGFREAALEALIASS